MGHRPAHVPQFGNWDANENVPFTVVFDNARAGKGGGRKFNPNDPEENPAAFGSITEDVSQPEEFEAAAFRVPSKPQPPTETGLSNPNRGDGHVYPKTGGADGARRGPNASGARENASSADGSRRGSSAIGARENAGPEDSPNHQGYQGRLGNRPGSPYWERRNPSDGGSPYASSAPGKSRLRGSSRADETVRNARNEQPRASIIEAPKEDVHCKGSPLSYAWGKVREHDAFILFDLGSTHNFISLELAAKIGIQEFEMGDAMKADGAFIGQDVSVIPLIGKLRLHIQGYVEKEDFFISPLKHEDVILRAPWFVRLAASIKFPERKISFKFREKDMFIVAQESCSSIPLVNEQAFEKSIKSSIFVYMIFVKDSLSDVNKTQLNESGMHEDLELSKFLNQFQDVFIDDIPRELPPKRGDDDHAIELIPGNLVLFCYLQPDRGAALPKFGAWDENDPSAGEGFTIIFNQARNEKKQGGATRVPPLQGESPANLSYSDGYKRVQGGKKSSFWSCCLGSSTSN
ncbi:hypothetical protein L7F22_005468 [Adiantum nelumboides]|nr:hypothetical protein [Adiantum nelumboides]